jgi:hypothetical protein
LAGDGEIMRLILEELHPERLLIGFYNKVINTGLVPGHVKLYRGGKTGVDLLLRYPVTILVVKKNRFDKKTIHLHRYVDRVDDGVGEHFNGIGREAVYRSSFVTGILRTVLLGKAGEAAQEQYEEQRRFHSVALTQARRV